MEKSGGKKKPKLAAMLQFKKTIVKKKNDFFTIYLKWAKINLLDKIDFQINGLKYRRIPVAHY